MSTFLLKLDDVPGAPLIEVHAVDPNSFWLIVLPDENQELINNIREEFDGTPFETRYRIIVGHEVDVTTEPRLTTVTINAQEDEGETAQDRAG